MKVPLNSKSWSLEQCTSTKVSTLTLPLQSSRKSYSSELPTISFRLYLLLKWDGSCPLVRMTCLLCRFCFLVNSIQIHCQYLLRSQSSASLRPATPVTALMGHYESHSMQELVLTRVLWCREKSILACFCEDIPGHVDIQTRPGTPSRLTHCAIRLLHR